MLQGTDQFLSIYGSKIKCLLPDLVCYSLSKIYFLLHNEFFEDQRLIDLVQKQY